MELDNLQPRLLPSELQCRYFESQFIKCMQLLLWNTGWINGSDQMDQYKFGVPFSLTMG